MHSNSTTNNLAQVVDLIPANEDARRLSNPVSEATCPACRTSARMRLLRGEATFSGRAWRDLLFERYRCDHCESRIEYLSPLAVGATGLMAFAAALFAIGWLIFQIGPW